MLKSLMAAAAVLVSVPALAADGLDDVLGQASGDCVPMAKVRAVKGLTETPLNDKQFEFVRGMWVVVPPKSSELPIGDRAEIITDGEDFGVILIDTEAQQTCARFHVHDIAGFLTLINAVGEGKTVSAKDAAGKGL